MAVARPPTQPAPERRQGCELKKCLGWRSRAVHSGKLDSKRDKAESDPRKMDEFISHAQELCSQAIKAIIREGSMPDWDAIVLGTS